MLTPSVRAFAPATAHPLWACWRSGHDDMVLARERPHCSKCAAPLLRTFPAFDTNAHRWIDGLRSAA